MEISPGAVIAGRYRADRKVGAGAMGEVWAGENISVGYKVAIKTMLEAAAVDHEVVARFKREAYILGKIRSDYVARVLDFAEDETYGLVLILDLIEGEVFSNTLKRTKLTVEEAIEIGSDVISGLVDLHNANIVHRDLKPSNIILQPRADGGQRAIIVDFGVSRLMKSDDPDEEITNITRADMALGTLEYMAPEQMLDSRNVTGGSDIYAVGAMLFRAVKGHHAFGNLADIELARKKLLEETPKLETGRDDPIAKGFEETIWRAVRRKPADRYKRAEEMLADLQMLRQRMLNPNNPAAGRRAMPSMVEDEPTVDYGSGVMEVELSASFQVDHRNEPTSLSSKRSSQVNRLSSGSTTASTMPPAPPASSPSAAPALPAPPRAPTIESVPPPARTGVATGLVVALVLVALIGGVALGVTMATERAPSEPQATSAEPTASAIAAPTETASATAAPAATPSIADAGIIDASSDAGRGPDASAGDGGAPGDGGSPYPFPQFAPKPGGGGPLPGGPLPGRPAGGPLPGAPQPGSGGIVAPKPSN